MKGLGSLRKGFTMESTVKSKKVFSFALVAVFAIVMAMGSATAAFAGNWQDKYYAVSSNGHGYTWTPSEYKEDYSSSWNDCRGASDYHQAQIGAQSANGGTVYFVSDKYNWWADKSGYMLNNVKENGYSWATLWIDGTAHVWANGYWSPDSI